MKKNLETSKLFVYLQKKIHTDYDADSYTIPEKPPLTGTSENCILSEKPVGGFLFLLNSQNMDAVRTLSNFKPVAL